MWNSLNRRLLVVAGTICVILAVIGILVPLLPTVPLLLLAAYCYARSSKRFYNLLLTHKLFGKIIANYQKGKGVPLWTKTYSLVLLWCVIGISVGFVLKSEILKLVLLLAGVLVSIHLMLLKSYRKGN